MPVSGFSGISERGCCAGTFGVVFDIAMDQFAHLIGNGNTKNFKREIQEMTGTGIKIPSLFYAQAREDEVWH